MTIWEAAMLLARVSLFGVAIITVLVGGGAFAGWIMREWRR